MAGLKDTRTFFTKGTVAEWEFILTLYKQALHLKAQQKNKKPEELIKLDTWFQEELPKLIQSRKEKHLTHDEIVQTMKWKLARGKWRPRLTDLVRINTPLAVMQVSKKAFRKLPNLASAVQALSGLKGIGPATASAILAAGAPELAPFMADECLMAIPECQAIDYTVQEYLIYSEQIQTVVERLNASAKNSSWTPHRVEKALWTFSIINEFSPSSLVRPPNNGTEDVDDDAALTSQNGKSETQGDDTVVNSDEKDTSAAAEENVAAVEKNAATEQRNDVAAEAAKEDPVVEHANDENGREEVEANDADDDNRAKADDTSDGKVTPDEAKAEETNDVAQAAVEEDDSSNCPAKDEKDKRNMDDGDVEEPAQKKSKTDE